MNITGGSNLSLFEVNEAAEIVISASDPEVNMIFGASIDDSMKDDIKVTVIATGFEHKGPVRRPISSSAPQSSPSSQTEHQDNRTSGHNLRPFGGSSTSSEQLDIPAFLRNRPRGDR